MQYLNISGYKFVPIENTLRMERHFRKLCRTLSVRGTILVGEEGVNVALAGEEKAIRIFQKNLHEDSRFSDIQFKESWSSKLPFRRLRVRVKQEIVTIRADGIDPRKNTGKYLDAVEFKRWLDEKRDITVLDTRNDYEVKIGTFEQAIDLNIENFRDFPKAVDQLPEAIKQKPVVMFCTGGIRCEKASAYCLDHGFSEVYQLHEGIIKYFEKCGDAHWRGECFVFDDRVAMKPDLSETDKKYCLACMAVLSESDLKSEQFRYNHHCPYCIKNK